MNVTTLNTTTLDGGGVIKKGGGGTPTPPSGGGNLSPDAIVYEPNGWYWKLTDELLADRELVFQIIFVLGIEMGTICEVVIHDSYIKGKRKMKYVYRDIGSMQYVYNNKIDEDYLIQNIWRAVSEAAPNTTYVDGMEIEYQSIYDILCIVNGEIPEEEFVAMMLSQFKIQRITKEEYEALITE